jgi:hypothetical protein
MPSNTMNETAQPTLDGESFLPAHTQIQSIMTAQDQKTLIYTYTCVKSPHNNSTLEELKGT